MNDREGKLTETGGQDDGANSSQLHRETTRRRVQGDAVTQVPHDVVSVCPDTYHDSDTTENAIQKSNSMSVVAPYGI